MYRDTLTQNNIYELQKEEINNNLELYVLNSFCLWPLDYFSKDFFDNVINNH